MRYLRLKLLKNKENNKKICDIVHHNFKNIYCYVTSEVSLKRFYFALFDDRTYFTNFEIGVYRFLKLKLFICTPCTWTCRDFFSSKKGMILLSRVKGKNPMLVDYLVAFPTIWDCLSKIFCLQRHNVPLSVWYSFGKTIAVRKCNVQYVEAQLFSEEFNWKDGWFVELRKVKEPTSKTKILYKVWCLRSPWQTKVLA